MADGENFMVRNRKINGAYDPSPKPNSKARQIAANGPIDQNPDDQRFSPNMSSPGAINDGHYMRDMTGAGIYGTSYEDKMPYTGERPLGEDNLKGR